MSTRTYPRHRAGGAENSRIVLAIVALLVSLRARAAAVLACVVPESTRGIARSGFTFGHGYARTYSARAGARRVLAGQGITGETKAILSFFALLVIGIFVLGSIDSNLDTSSLDTNYTSASEQTSGGFLDFVNIGIVLPVVVVGGLMLGVITRVI